MPGSDVSLTNIKVTVEDVTEELKKAFTGKTPDKFVGCWNVDKRAKYRAVSNKVLYEIVICIDETDEEYIKDFSGAKDVWEGLRAKYSKTRPQTIREDLKKLVNYKLDSDPLLKTRGQSYDRSVAVLGSLTLLK